MANEQSCREEVHRRQLKVESNCDPMYVAVAQKKDPATQITGSFETRILTS
jgi:hypothetical protein